MATDLISQKPIPRLPAFAGILREEQHYATGRSDDVADRLNGWFDRLMVQSGLGVTPTVMLLLSILSGIACGGTAFVLREHLLSTALAALLGFLAPVCITLLLRSRRQTQLLNQLPGMLGELARAARTGRSLQQCFEVVAQDTPAPLGTELRLCVRRMQMGLSPATALQDLPERTGLVSLNVLVMALSVHQQAGGDLVSVLERLARTIRDRLTFLGRLRAATAASRATALLMIAVPPGILTFFSLRDPGYLNDLLASSWGRGTLILAITLQVLGSIWVLRILKNSQRT